QTGVREQAWHYPSRAECMACHTRAANWVLGLCTPQMNSQLGALEQAGLMKDLDWQSKARDELTERATAKGLKDKGADEFVKLHGPQPGQRGVPGTKLLPSEPANLPRMVDPYDPKQDLAKRAKSWLHVNCSQCHVEAGGGNARMELEFTTALDKMRLIDVKPLHHTFDLPDARLVAPSSPERSVLLHRLSHRNAGHMPQLTTSMVDPRALPVL